MGDVKIKSNRIKVPESFVEANDYLYEKGWTDGLPVIPPTSERVLAMLSTVDRDPHEIVGHVEPIFANATIEKIAINAVMAGCLPEYFPVVVAAIEAVTSPPFKLLPTGTNPCVPLLVINGPVRKKLNINCEYNALGSGYRSNATIGRAVRLALVNIGRVAVRPGVEGVLDQTTLGHPGRFTFCMGENEEANPWEPLHVERGFNHSDSTVSVFNAVSVLNILDSHSKTAKSLLTTIVGSMTILGTNNISHYPSDPLLCLGPEHANTLAREGLSKKDVKQYLYEHTKVPLSSFSEDVAKFLTKINRPTADDMVYIAGHPEHITIVVAGGLGPHSAFVTTHGRGPVSVTKQIVLKNQ